MQDWKTRLRELPARLEALFEKYGKLALVIYFSMFGATFLAFYVAIDFGWDAKGTVATAGSIGAAYAMTRLTQPVRIGLTLVLVPLVSRALGRKADPQTPPPPPSA